jgi:hypothetical protein
MKVRFKTFLTILDSYTQQGLSNHITFTPFKSGAKVPLKQGEVRAEPKNDKILRVSLKWKIILAKYLLSSGYIYTCDPNVGW